MADPTTTAPLLRVTGLGIDFPGLHGRLPVVEDVSFDLARGEVLGLVGESGSGKTVTSLALSGLIQHRGGRVFTGSVQLEGEELVGLSEARLAKIRGRRIGMIFQQPILALNPAYTVGDQIAETVRRHKGLTRRDAWNEAVRMLERVGIADAAKRARDYPHRFSGGMSQRVMIAQALVCGPSILVADEPTTALDVTVQARVLKLLRDLQAEMGLSVLLITHDLGVIAEMCDRVIVMYAGQIVESASAERLLLKPNHPYTQALLRAVPTRDTKRLVEVPGTVPAAGAMPAGCRFSNRCPHAQPQCATPFPLSEAPDGGLTRCGRARELYGAAQAGAAQPAAVER